MSDLDDLEYCKSALRRKYPATGPDAAAALSALVTLANEVFSTSTEEVTLIATSFQGGYAGSMRSFNRRILGMALEAVITERGEDYAPSTDIIQLCP